MMELPLKYKALNFEEKLEQVRKTRTARATKKVRKSIEGDLRSYSIPNLAKTKKPREKSFKNKSKEEQLDYLNKLLGD